MYTLPWVNKTRYTSSESSIFFLQGFRDLYPSMTEDGELLLLISNILTQFLQRQRLCSRDNLSDGHV